MTATSLWRDRTRAPVRRGRHRCVGCRWSRLGSASQGADREVAGSVSRGSSAASEHAIWGRVAEQDIERQRALTESVARGRELFQGRWPVPSATAKTVGELAAGRLRRLDQGLDDGRLAIALIRPIGCDRC